MSVLGFTNPSVSSTNQLFNIVAIPSGVYRYLREGRMVWPLTWAVIIGTLPGVLLGAWVRVAWLPDPRRFKLFAAAVLGYIGCRMVRDLLFKKSGGPDKAKAEKGPPAPVRGPGPAAASGAPGGRGLPAARVVRFTAARIAYAFQGETYDVSTPGIFALSLVVGVVGGVYGIGGGSIIAPFFVSIYGLPVYTVAGAALMGTFVTSVAGVAFYQASPVLSAHVRGPGLGAGAPVRPGRNGGHVSRRPLPAVRSGQDHQGHAHGDHFFHRLEIRGRISPITRRTIRPVPGILRSRPEIRGRPKISHSTVKYFRVGPKRGHGQTARPGHETPVAACRVQPWRA
jgi:uncharacterized membrane protein YfcA